MALSGYHLLYFLNNFVDDVESTQTLKDYYVIIASLKCESVGKLINRIPGSRLLISSLLGSLLRTHVESLAMSTSIFKALPGNLDIKRHPPSILYFPHLFWTIVVCYFFCFCGLMAKYCKQNGPRSDFPLRSDLIKVRQCLLLR